MRLFFAVRSEIIERKKVRILKIDGKENGDGLAVS
jgi:hypothetical protein